MNKLVMMVAGLAMMVCLVGCGGSSPESVAEKTVACLKDCDFEGMKKYATGDYKKGLTMMEAMFKAAAEDDKEEYEKSKKEAAAMKVTIGTAVIDGDKATVPVTLDGKDKKIKLVKVDGKWMVEDFNFKDIN